MHKTYGNRTQKRGFVCSHSYKVHNKALTKSFKCDKVYDMKRRLMEMKKIISTEKAPVAIGPYAQGVAAGKLIITSGQLPLDPATGTFPEGIKEQTRQSLTNVKAILEEGGADMKDVIKTTVFLSDMNNFGAMNEVYAEFFGEGGYPSRSAVEVARLPKDALVEIEVIAVAP